MMQPSALSPSSQNILMKVKLSPLPCPPHHSLSVQCSSKLFSLSPPPFTPFTIPPSFFPCVVSSHPLISLLISPPHLCFLHSTHGWFPSSFSSLSPPHLTSPHSSSCLPLLFPSSSFPLPSVIRWYITAMRPCLPLSHTVCVWWEGDSPGETRDYIVFLPVKEVFSSLEFLFKR